MKFVLIGIKLKKFLSFLGFTDVDLEKPCFEIKPMTDKVPFCVSKEGASPQFIVSMFFKFHWIILYFHQILLAFCTGRYISLSLLTFTTKEELKC